MVAFEFVLGLLLAGGGVTILLMRHRIHAWGEAQRQYTSNVHNNQPVVWGFFGAVMTVFGLAIAVGSSGLDF